MKRGTAGTLRALIEDDRQQRAATVLRDVAYVVEAHFVLTAAAASDDTEASTRRCSTAAPPKASASTAPIWAPASSRPILP